MAGNVKEWCSAWRNISERRRRRWLGPFRTRKPIVRPTHTNRSATPSSRS